MYHCYHRDCVPETSETTTPPVTIVNESTLDVGRGLSWVETLERGVYTVRTSTLVDGEL